MLVFFFSSNPIVSLSSFGLDKKLEKKKEGGKQEEAMVKTKRTKQNKKVRITPIQTGPFDLVFTGNGFKRDKTGRK